MTSEAAPSDRSGLLLIPLAAFVAVLPLILHGCSCGHDFDFHLLNWMESARQFSQGNLHPHWAFSPAFNAGEPRFVFYPPLSWYLGALLGLLLTHLPGVTQAAAWTATPICFTWIALAASGLTMYRLARAYGSQRAALLAATLYLANPYILFVAYERTAYAELLAAAWIPLLFGAILAGKVTTPRIALPVALLWLTNVPAAIIGSYALALLGAIRVVLGQRKDAAGALQLALRTIAGTALGLALAAFYIIPAAYERRWVQIAMATIADLRIDQNFLLEHTGTSPNNLLHDQVLHTASLIAVILLTGAAIALVAIWRATKPSAPRLAADTWESRPRTSFPVLPLAILTTGIAFLLTPLSAPIWNHAPEASFLQFPWRLLVMIAPVFALALAYALIERPGAASFALLRKVGRMKFVAQATAVLLATTLTFPAYDLFRQTCDPADTAPARLAVFQSNGGTDPTDEYTPVPADNEILKLNNPSYWLADSPDAPAPPTIAPGPAPTHLILAASRAQDLILNLREYPAWRITVNGVPAPHPAQRPDGLVVIPISAGPSTIDIRYAQAFDQTLGYTVTLIALALFLVTLHRERCPGS